MIYEKIHLIITLIGTIAVTILCLLEKYSLTTSLSAVIFSILGFYAVAKFVKVFALDKIFLPEPAGEAPPILAAEEKQENQPLKHKDDESEDYSFDGYKSEDYSFDGYKSEDYSFDGDKSEDYSFDGDKSEDYSFDGYDSDDYNEYGSEDAEFSHEFAEEVDEE